VLLIARLRELGRDLLIPENELLDAILHNVVGFDLNPLAVLTARVNYLLAIADLLPHRKRGHRAARVPRRLDPHPRART
jgi:hypothetical protein